MKKLKLQLDDLRIDSFDTTAVQKEKGTVVGEQYSYYTNCTCPGLFTCDQSCNGTCGASCQTCGDDTCFVSCQMSECWRNGACVVW